VLNTRDRTGINFQYLHKISVISFFYLKIYYWKALINIIWKTTDIYIYFLKILFVRINNMYKCTKIIAYPIIVYSSLIVSTPSSDTSRNFGNIWKKLLIYHVQAKTGFLFCMKTNFCLWWKNLYIYCLLPTADQPQIGKYQMTDYWQWDLSRL
jgi:hypothetical protein